MILTVFEVSQSNSRLNALNEFTVLLHSVRMPVGFGWGIKTKGRELSVMAHLKKIIIEVKAVTKYLAHVLIIAINELSRLHGIP